jgi:hypothetical protein
MFYYQIGSCMPEITYHTKTILFIGANNKSAKLIEPPQIKNRPKAA